MEESKNITGERLETTVYNDNTYEHLHRYALCINFIKDKIVLDIASGEGYGSKLLANYARRVIGVDIDENSIKNAKEKYNLQNLDYEVGSTDLIPLNGKAVDVVVSFETIEHHDKHYEMLTEIKRVLKPGGLLIISTPDKKSYTDETGFKNPFHVKELYLDEFKTLISSYFKNTYYYYQNTFKGSIIKSEEGGGNFKLFDGDFNRLNLVERIQIKPMYFIAIASDSEISNDGESIFFSPEIEMRDKEEKDKKIKFTDQYIKSLEKNVELIKNSWSYRIGNLLLRPFRIFGKN